MKKKITAIAIFLLTLNAAKAQKSDTTNVSIKVVTTTTNNEHKTTTISTQTEKQEISTTTTHHVKPRIQWFSTFDLGFNNFTDHSNYSAANAAGFTQNFDDQSLKLRAGKSVHVGIWIFEHLVPLVKHNINLNYGLVLDLNNYRFANNVRFNKNPGTGTPTIYLDNDMNKNYKKTKLAADYITMPVMLNFNFAKNPTRKSSTVKKDGKTVALSIGSNKGYGFSLGASAGYLYTARNKFVNNIEGKKKIKDDFGLRPWKISYEGELNLGAISLFGTYTPQSMFKNYLDINPYTFGIRL